MELFGCQIIGLFLLKRFQELRRGSYSKTEIFTANHGDHHPHLKERVDTLMQSLDYVPPLYCVLEYHGQLQTIAQFTTRNITRLIRSAILPPYWIRYTRELLVLPDGGTIALDWAQSSTHNTHNIPPTAPVIIMHHGLVGDSQSEYIYHMAWRLLQAGYRVVVLVARGCGGLELTSPAMFAGRRTGDISAGVHRVRHLYPTSKLFLVGFSLGAALSLQYLAEGHIEDSAPSGDTVSPTGGEPSTRVAKMQNPLTAALCVCPPWNVAKNTLESGYISAVWMTFLVIPLKIYYLVHRNYLHTVAPSGVGGISLWELFWARDIAAFDGLFHPTHFKAAGQTYACLREYYDDVSPVHCAGHITTPTMVLTAKDDPLCMHSHAPTNAAELGPGLVVVRARHCGLSFCA